MDWLVVLIGVIIMIAAVLLAFYSGMKKGSSKVRTEYKDYISLAGLSLTAKEKLKGYVQIVQVWDLHRRPDKDRFKPVHYD